MEWNSTYDSNSRQKSNRPFIPFTSRKQEFDLVIKPDGRGAARKVVKVHFSNQKNDRPFLCSISSIVIIPPTFSLTDRPPFLYFLLQYLSSCKLSLTWKWVCRNKLCYNSTFSLFLDCTLISDRPRYGSSLSTGLGILNGKILKVNMKFQ